MPEISLFFGIRITINYNDHVPPHFHAEYNGEKALVDIINGRVMKGYLASSVILPSQRGQTLVRIYHVQALH